MKKLFLIVLAAFLHLYALDSNGLHQETYIIVNKIKNAAELSFEDIKDRIESCRDATIDSLYIEEEVSEKLSTIKSTKEVSSKYLIAYENFLSLFMRAYEERDKTKSSEHFYYLLLNIKVTLNLDE